MSGGKSKKRGRFRVDDRRFGSRRTVRRDRACVQRSSAAGIASCHARGAAPGRHRAWREGGGSVASPSCSTTCAPPMRAGRRSVGMPPKVSVARAKTKTASSREPTSIVAKTIKDLELSPDVALVLRDIEAQIAEAYRDRFLDMTEMLRQQMSMAARTQETLNILVEFLAPQLAGSVPTAGEDRYRRVAARPRFRSSCRGPDRRGLHPDAGRPFFRALGVSSADISILVRGFDVNGKEECAVTVRTGRKAQDRQLPSARGRCTSPLHRESARRCSIEQRREGGAEESARPLVRVHDGLTVKGVAAARSSRVRQRPHLHRWTIVPSCSWSPFFRVGPPAVRSSSRARSSFRTYNRSITSSSKADNAERSASVIGQYGGTEMSLQP